MPVVDEVSRGEEHCGGGGTGTGTGNTAAWGVYCGGPLLEAVQSARLYPDSKTFVDMPMKQDPDVVLAAFDSLSVLDKKDPDKLALFVSEHFDEAGSDIVPVTPKDFCPHPSFLESIEDVRRREWARSIHSMWALLVRENVADVDAHPQRHSLLQRQHPVVVPGGRFRESYYWDTFWTIRGLVVSGMVDTARGAVLNLLDDVDRFGFVPNGGRLYYTTRSQPPLLSDMVCEIYSAKPEDREFLARALPSLEAEHAFWMDSERGRSVRIPRSSDAAGSAAVLNRYWGSLDPPTTPGRDGDAARAGKASGKGLVGGPLPSRPPRPESFREDAEAALGKCTCGDGGGDGICHELAAAAESGWDFSSRWAGVASRDGERVTPPSPPEGEEAVGGSGGEGERQRQQQRQQQRQKSRKKAFRLCQSATTSVVPVDLNAFLHRAELNIARLHHALDVTAAVLVDDADGGGARAAGEAVEANKVAPTTPQPPLLSLGELQRQLLLRLRDDGGSEGEDIGGGEGGLAETKLTPRQSEMQSVSLESGGDEPSVGGGKRPLCRKAVFFGAAARARAETMETTMWDKSSGLWRDLLLPTGEQSSTVTPACFVPMWAGLPWPVLVGNGDSNDGDAAGVPTTTVAAAVAAEDQDQDVEVEPLRLARCVEALRLSGLVRPGGVRTSLEESGQQWDGRNAWPPLQWMLVQGLRRWADALTTTTPLITTAPAETVTPNAAAAAAAAAKSLAWDIEEAFLDGALAGWEATGGMMEKYDANETGKGGGGGEYNVQVGFGWTNGVALDLLAGRSQLSP